MTNATENAFSLRRLNPFNGVLQVFLSDSARALSSNGSVWEIQVLSDKPQGLWANVPFSEQQFYTFGLWSPTHGLRQVPVNPLFNVREMITSSERLIEQLQPVLDQLPFPPADPFEAWLLDETTGQPVALLMSCRDEEELRERKTAKWIATERGDFSFVSPTLSQRDQPCDDGYNPRVHASILEAQVRGRGGLQPRHGWYYRRADGSASPCDGREIPVDGASTPELPLTEDWEAREEQELIGDYIAWKAPQLLMLPHLSSDTRERLERQAVKQAEAVDRLWRLYPHIHSQDLLNCARVEARIRTSQRK